MSGKKIVIGERERESMEFTDGYIQNCALIFTIFIIFIHEKKGSRSSGWELKAGFSVSCATR